MEFKLDSLGRKRKRVEAIEWSSIGVPKEISKRFRQFQMNNNLRSHGDALKLLLDTVDDLGTLESSQIERTTQDDSEFASFDLSGEEAPFISNGSNLEAEEPVQNIDIKKTSGTVLCLVFEKIILENGQQALIIVKSDGGFGIKYGFAILEIRNNSNNFLFDLHSNSLLKDLIHSMDIRIKYKEGWELSSSIHRRFTIVKNFTKSELQRVGWTVKYIYDDFEEKILLVTDVKDGGKAYKNRILPGCVIKKIIDEISGEEISFNVELCQLEEKLKSCTKFSVHFVKLLQRPFNPPKKRNARKHDELKASTDLDQVNVDNSSNSVSCIVKNVTQVYDQNDCKVENDMNDYDSAETSSRCIATVVKTEVEEQQEEIPLKIKEEPNADDVVPASEDYHIKEELSDEVVTSADYQRRIGEDDLADKDNDNSEETEVDMTHDANGYSIPPVDNYRRISSSKLSFLSRTVEIVKPVASTSERHVMISEPGHVFQEKSPWYNPVAPFVGSYAATRFMDKRGKWHVYCDLCNQPVLDKIDAKNTHAFGHVPEHTNTGWLYQCLLCDHRHAFRTLTVAPIQEHVLQRHGCKKARLKFHYTVNDSAYQRDIVENVYNSCFPNISA